MYYITLYYINVCLHVSTNCKVISEHSNKTEFKITTKTFVKCQPQMSVLMRHNVTQCDTMHTSKIYTI
jgi:hypothetical protein